MNYFIQFESLNLAIETRTPDDGSVKRIATITYHEIRQHKLDNLDWNDVRTSTRNSIGDRVNEGSDLEFDFKHPDNIQLLGKLSEYILPPLKAIKMVSPTRNSTLAYKFLLYSFPANVDLLTFDAFDEKHRTKFENFLNPLLKISPFVQKELWLGKWVLTAHEFIKIIEAYSHCDQITFHNCRIPDLESHLTFKKSLEYNYK